MFSYKLLPIEIIDQIFAFWASQSLKLNRNTCFLGFNSSLEVNSHVAKPEKLALKNVNFSLLSFKWRSYDNDFWPINLRDLSKILGA